MFLCAICIRDRPTTSTHARTARTTHGERATHTRASHRGETPVRGAPSEGLEREVPIDQSRPATHPPRGANRPITTSDTHPPTRSETRSEKWPEKQAAFIRKSHIDDASRGASRASRVLNTHSKYTRRIYTYITPKEFHHVTCHIYNLSFYRTHVAPTSDRARALRDLEISSARARATARPP